MKSAAGRAVLVALGVAVALCVTLSVSSQGAGASTGAAAQRTLAKADDTSTCPSGTGAVSDTDLKVVDGLATGTFSIAAGCSGVQVSLASYETSSASFSLPQTLFKSSTNTFSGGGPFSLSVDVPSCFYQVDLVIGDVIEQLTADDLYGSRKLAFASGGSGSCTTPPPPPPVVCPGADQAVTGASLVVSGGVATGTFMVAPGCSDVEVSLASYTAPGATFALPQTLFDSSTGTFNAGGPYTLTADVPPCFYQVDLVRGPVITELTATHLYYERKLAFANGGTSCTTTPPVVTPPVVTPPPVTGAVGGAAASPPAVQTVDVSITKVADPITATVGDTVGYTLNVSNAGPATAADVTVAEDLPSGLTLISVTASTGSCSGVGPVLCSLGSLVSGASASIHIEAHATAPGTIVNTATVSTSSPETNTANNKAQATVTVNAAATAPFTPPTVCSSLSAPHRTLLSAQQTTFTVKVVRGGKPVAGARVRAKGPGISIVRLTSAAGMAHFSIRPRSAGTVELTLLQGNACKPQQSAFAVLAARVNKLPMFTG